jgi:alpha-D-xyloside xylohydrolase
VATVDATGVTFTVGTGKMKVQVCAADIIRVMYTSASHSQKTSLSVSNTWAIRRTFLCDRSRGER